MVAPDSQRHGSKRLTSYLRVFHYADRTSRCLNAAALLAAIGAGIPLPLMEIVFGRFVSTFVQFSNGQLSASDYLNEAEKLALYFIYLFLGKFVLGYIHTTCVSIAAIRTTKALRLHFLQCLLRQEIAFFDSKEAGSPAVKVTTTSNLVNQGISEKLSLTVQSISTFVAAFVVAFISQWKLTLITLAVVPVIVGVTFFCMAIDSRNESKLLTIYSKAGLFAEEVFSTIATVHSFWLQPTMIKRYDALLEEAEKEGLKKKVNYGVLYSIEFFSIYAAYALAFWQGIRMFQSGEIEQAGKVVTVIFAMVVAATALTSIAPQVLAITKAISASDELFQTIDRQPLIDSMSSDGKQPSSCAGEIRVGAVEFAYPSRPDSAVLRGLHLSIPAGKTTALVGESGCGKSSLFGLLERWYDYSAGSITIDGVELRSLNIKWLRQNVRLIQQEPVLFSGSVFENVAYGLIGTPYENSTREEQMVLVQQACRDAFAHDFIQRLPQGYDTAVGERARMLSGGQKQRIAIARSIISNPPILLMDEATSALDPQAEEVVQEALNHVSINRTTVIIAHKLSTIQSADSIAVMSRGTVIEQGTHQELLARGAAYAKLVQAQNLKAAEGSDSRSSSEEEEDEKLQITNSARTLTNTTPDEGYGENEKHDIEAIKTKDIGILRCVAMMIMEQPELWSQFIIVGIVAVLGGLIYPAQAMVFSGTFSVFEGRSRHSGNFWALMFFVLSLAVFFIYFVMGWVSVTMSQRMTRKHRLHLFTSALYQDMDFFDKPENESGGLTSRLSSAATNLQELISFNIGLITVNVVNVVASAVFGIAVGWKLALVCIFGGLPPMLYSGYLRIRLESKLDEATSIRFSSSAAVAAEAVSAIRTVSSLTLEDSILSRYAEKLSDVVQQSVKSLALTMIWYNLSQSVQFLAMALGFWYGSKLISTGEYSTTQFFRVFIAIFFSAEAAAVFFQYTTSITKAKSAANLMMRLRKSASDHSEVDSDSEDKSSGPASIEYQSTRFTYPSRPHAPILKGINVKIPAGQFVAFVGPSGCGKTTMISLLSRFYDHTSGEILVNGSPITAQSPRKHRRRIGLVQQEPVLYQGTIRDNIALGVADTQLGGPPSETEIQEACRQANIHTFVQSLPEGLNTDVGWRGSQLSGGQKQRVAIARAIMRNPSIMLLDEATSALDTESERIVQAALMEAAKQGSRTTVAVAHRLSTIRDADQIFVFEAGRIAEVGTHNSLMAKGGRYFHMSQSQALNQAAE